MSALYKRLEAANGNSGDLNVIWESIKKEFEDRNDDVNEWAATVKVAFQNVNFDPPENGRSFHNSASKANFTDQTADAALRRVAIGWNMKLVNYYRWHKAPYNILQHLRAAARTCEWETSVKVLNLVLLLSEHEWRHLLHLPCPILARHLRTYQKLFKDDKLVRQQTQNSSNKRNFKVTPDDLSALFKYRIDYSEHLIGQRDLKRDENGLLIPNSAGAPPIGELEIKELTASEVSSEWYNNQSPIDPRLASETPQSYDETSIPGNILGSQGVVNSDPRRRDDHVVLSIDDRSDTHESLTNTAEACSDAESSPQTPEPTSLHRSRPRSTRAIPLSDLTDSGNFITREDDRTQLWQNSRESTAMLEPGRELRDTSINTIDSLCDGPYIEDSTTRSGGLPVTGSTQEAHPGLDTARVSYARANTSESEDRTGRQPTSAAVFSHHLHPREQSHWFDEIRSRISQIERDTQGNEEELKVT